MANDICPACDGMFDARMNRVTGMCINCTQVEYYWARKEVEQPGSIRAYRNTVQMRSARIALISGDRFEGVDVPKPVTKWRESRIALRIEMRKARDKKAKKANKKQRRVRKKA